MTLRTIEDYLIKSSNVFVINSIGFHLTLAIARSVDLEKLNLKSFTTVDVALIIPDILEILKEARTTINLESIYEGRLFPLELVTSHGFSWVATSSKIYEHTLKSSTHHLMEDWQRFLRAVHSTSKVELAYLALDPNLKIREQATKRIQLV